MPLYATESRPPWSSFTIIKIITFLVLFFLPSSLSSLFIGIVVVVVVNHCVHHAKRGE
jgi:hypothetical protein